METKMYQEIVSQKEKIIDCENYNSEKLLELSKIINEFNPQNIVLVGRGSSYHAGIFAKYLLEIYYNIPVSIASQSVTTIYKSDIDYSRSLIICISQSGDGEDNLDIIVKGNKKGALTIGITNEIDSLLAKNAAHVLYMNASKAEAYAATKTLTNSLYLILKLVYALTGRKELNINANEISDVIEKSLTLRDKIKKVVIPYKNINDLFILSRGYSLSLAIEMSVKLKEACLMYASAYPTSEFWHGPIAMINKNTPAIFFAVDKNINKNIEEMIEEFNKKDIDILLFTNDKSLLKKAKNDIYFECDSDFKAYFFALILLQLFTNELALLKGTDSDFNPSLEFIKTY